MSTVAETLGISVLLSTATAVVFIGVMYVVPERFETYPEAFSAVYLVYFGGSFLYTVLVSELSHTPILGIRLGNSPVFALVLAVSGVGMSIGVVVYRVAIKNG